ncbi:hypothetical protein ACFXIY_25390 [Streptomyces albidoflavus]
MELLGKLNAWLRDGGGTAVSALAEVRADLRASAAMQPRPDDWVGLATLPVPLDEADVRLLAEAARGLDRAVRDDPATLLHGDLGTAMERLRTPEALRPFVLADTPLEVRLSRADFLLGRGGWQANEINICAGLGGLRVSDYDACVARQPLLNGFFATHGYRPLTPMDALARAAHRRCARLPGGEGRPFLAVVDWEGYDTAYLQDHLRIAAYYEARGFDTAVCNQRELRFAQGRLRLRGRPVDVVQREFLLEDIGQDPHSARPVLRAAAEGAAVMVTGFRAEWWSQKLSFAVLHEAARAGLLPADTAALVRRRVPETWLLTPELAGAGAAGPPARAEAVLKPSIGSLSQGVHLGADLTEKEFRAALQEAAADPHRPHVLQRLIPPATVPFPHYDEARDEVTFPESQLSIGVFVVDGVYAGAWSKVCARSRPTVIAHGNGGLWGSVWQPEGATGSVPAAHATAEGTATW